MGSASFGSRWPKLGVYAQASHPQYVQPVHICSFHLDNVSAPARPEQAKVLLSQLDLLYPNCENAFLMGDANDSPQSPTVQTFLDAGFSNPFEPLGPLVTYHDFGRPEHAAHIDYIFSRSPNFRLQKTFVDNRKDDFYSDHYYLSATFELS
jgi:endonuclease/exonuclease/phosphatase family metal-dependent hydrolase